MNALSPSAGALTPQETGRRAAAPGDWFQNMDLGGAGTAPNHLPGNYPGVKSFEMKRRGAARVPNHPEEEVCVCRVNPQEDRRP